MFRKAGGEIRTTSGVIGVFGDKKVTGGEIRVRRHLVSNSEINDYKQ